MLIDGNKGIFINNLIYEGDRIETKDSLYISKGTTLNINGLSLNDDLKDNYGLETNHVDINGKEIKTGDVWEIDGNLYIVESYSNSVPLFKIHDSRLGKVVGDYNNKELLIDTLIK